MLKKHILKDIVPRRFDVRIEEIQENHRQAIEEKDARCALLNDDLKNHDKQIQAIQYENVAQQAQRDAYKDQLQKCQGITHLKTRHVPLAKDPGKDNVVMIIEKNTAPKEDEFYEYPYYIVRIKRRLITTKKKRWFKARYPHHRFITEEVDNASSIHAFNWFEEKRYVERFQCHFRLAYILRDVFYALATPTIQE